MSSPRVRRIVAMTPARVPQTIEAIASAADCMPLLIERGAERAMTKLHSRAAKGIA